MKTITDILKSSNTPFAKTLKKVQSAQDLDAILSIALDPDLAKHCHAASYQKSILVLAVPNSSWATRLRYAIPEITKNLRIQPEFKKLTKIRYVITNTSLPTNNIPNPKTPPKLSTHQEKMWRNTLRKLQQHIKNRTNAMRAQQKG